MHKRGNYNKVSFNEWDFFFKENMYNQCFHSISIESISTFDVVLIFLVRKHQILYWKNWI